MLMVVSYFKWHTTRSFRVNFSLGFDQCFQNPEFLFSLYDLDIHLPPPLRTVTSMSFLSPSWLTSISTSHCIVEEIPRDPYFPGIRRERVV